MILFILKDVAVIGIICGTIMWSIKTLFTENKIDE